MDDVTIGQRVQRERKLRRLTQAELGDQVGCSAAAIRKMDADEHRPAREVAVGLATSRGVRALRVRRRIHAPDPRHLLTFLLPGA